MPIPAAANEAPPAFPVDGLLLALGALVATAFAAAGVDPLTTDSLSYLDVAANLRAGRGAVHSVVDFWRPGVPDPLGLWPPGFPALVALVSGFGLSLEGAARIVAAGSLAVFTFAFHALAARALGRALAALVTVLAVTLPAVAALGTHVWSEAPFLALLAGGLALSFPGHDHRPGPRRAALAGLLVGLAALTRYAGVPLALAAAGAARWLPAGSRARLAFAAGALLPPAAWTVRNLATFGRPFGPPLAPPRADLATQAFELARALRWELLPVPFDRTAAAAALPLLVLLAGVGLALARPGIGRVAGIVALILLATVLAATTLSGINAPTGRYLAPALPFLLLAAVAGLTGVPLPGARRSLVSGFVAVLALAAGVEALGARPDGTAGRLAGRADRAALGRLVGAGTTPVLSDAGHLVRAATGRAAVHIPPPAFRLRDYTPADDARWARAGVSEAVMAGGPPPSGAWVVAASAGRFTLYARVPAPDAGTP